MYFFQFANLPQKCPDTRSGFGSFRPVINYPLGSGSIIEDYVSEDYLSKDPDTKEISMDPQHCLVRTWIQQQEQNRQKFNFSFSLSPKYVQFLLINIRFGHICTCR